MTRKEFLANLGLGAAFVLTSTCLGSCDDNEGNEPSGGSTVDFTVDLTAASSAPLQNNGGYIVTNDVVVAKTMSGAYVAATVVCSHAGNRNIILSNDQWFCTVHGAEFELNGNGLNANASNGLTIYNVETLDANTLRVFA